MTRNLPDLTPDPIAERLTNAPRPTLSAEAQQRIAARLLTQGVTPVAAGRPIPHIGWMFAAACLSLFLGAGLLLFFNQENPENITRLTQSAVHATTRPTSVPQMTPSAQPTATTLTPAPTTNTTPLPGTPNVECKRGMGYWFNHPEAWSVDSLVLGGQTYTQAELLALQGATRGDASLILSRQLLAATLNGVSDPALDAAHALLTEYNAKLPLEISPSTDAGKAMLDLASQLATLNGCGENEAEGMNATTPTADDDNTNGTPDICKNPPPDHAPADGWHERCDALNPATRVPPGQGKDKDKDKS